MPHGITQCYLPSGRGRAATVQRLVLSVFKYSGHVPTSNFYRVSLQSSRIQFTPPTPTVLSRRIMRCELNIIDDAIKCRCFWSNSFLRKSSEKHFEFYPVLKTGLKGIRRLLNKGTTPSWFSFDRNIFRRQNRQLNEHKYFFLYIFQNHRGITVSPDELCFEKWKFVQPRP